MVQVQALGVPRLNRPLLATAAVLLALVVSSVVYASSPSSNTISACYQKKSGLVMIPKGRCPKGTVAISWSRSAQITAQKPLGVHDPSGQPLTVSLNGIVPVSHGGTGSSRVNFVNLWGWQRIAGTKVFTSLIHGSISGHAAAALKALDFTGSLRGDVTGSQEKTRVTGINGVPISSGAPKAGQTLTFNGNKWAAASSSDPGVTPTNLSRLAIDRTYPKNLTDFEVPAGAHPQAIAYDGAHLWVTDQDIPQGVTRIDLYNASRVPMFIPLPGCDAVADTYDGSRIWVVCGDDSGGPPSVGGPALVEISGNLDAGVVRLQGPQCGPTATTATGAAEMCLTKSFLPPGSVSPDAIVFDGSRLWIANEGSGNILVLGDRAYPFNVNGGEPAGSEIDSGPLNGYGDILCGTDPDGTTDDGQGSNIGDNGGYISLPSNGSPIGAGPTSMVYDGSRMWVADRSANEVVSLPDPQVEPVATGGPFRCPTVTHVYKVSGQPTSIAYDPVNNAIWAVSEGLDTLTKITPENGAAKVSSSVTVATGAGPHFILFDGDDLWISADNGYVYEFNPFTSPARLVAPPVPMFPQRSGQPNPCEGMAFDGTNIWCAHKYANSVREL